MSKFKLKHVEWNDPDADGLRRLRQEVFVVEQDVPPDMEFDEIDLTAFHVVVINENGEIVATGRLYDPDGTGKVGRIGRMAVAKKARRKGVGSLVLKGLLDEGKRRGYTRFILDAQVHAIPFYESCGFRVFGGEHLDCGIPHKMMERIVGEADISG